MTNLPPAATISKPMPICISEPDLGSAAWAKPPEVSQSVKGAMEAVKTDNATREYFIEFIFSFLFDPQKTFNEITAKRKARRQQFFFDFIRRKKKMSFHRNPWMGISRQRARIRA
jgi:hypothetical protein